MKAITKISICTLLSLIPTIGWGQNVDTLTMKDCVDMALKQNRSILLSEESAKSAAGRVAEAKGAGNLQANVFGKASDRSGEEDLPLAVGIDAGNNLIFQNAPLVPSSGSSYGVALTKVLDISGLVKTGTQVARLGEDSAKLDVTRTVNDTVLQTKVLYYDVLRNEELVSVAEESMRNAQIRKDTAQALVDAGINSKVDIIRADASISAAEQQIISAKNAVQVSKSAMNRILGREINAPIELAKPDDAPRELATYEDSLNEALANRPEVAMAKTGVDISEKRYKLAKRGMSPSAVLTASAQIDNAYNCPQDESATLGISVVFPLSDGGTTGGRTKQSAAEIESSRIAEEETEAQVALQVKSAYVHVQNADEKLATAKKQEEQAAESLRLSRSRYEEGISSQVELSDAELLFTQAQTNVVNAHFELLASQAELDRALGKYAGKD